MKDWLYPGAKVVCVDASIGRLRRDKHGLLVDGKIYTVAEVTSEFEEVAVRIAGMHSDGEYLAARRFRPLQKHKTSIEVFRKLLKTDHETSPEFERHETGVPFQ